MKNILGVGKSVERTCFPGKCRELRPPWSKALWKGFAINIRWTLWQWEWTDFPALHFGPTTSNTQWQSEGNLGATRPYKQVQLQGFDSLILWRVIIEHTHGAHVFLFIGPLFIQKCLLFCIVTGPVTDWIWLIWGHFSSILSKISRNSRFWVSVFRSGRSVLDFCLVYCKNVLGL